MDVLEQCCLIHKCLLHMPAGCANCSDVPRATMVARTLFFAPLLTGLADEIVAGMEAAGVETFNSLHLRIEKDAKDWSMIMGGAGVSMQTQQSLPCKGWATTGLKEPSAQSWVCLSTCKEKGIDKGAQATATQHADGRVCHVQVLWQAYGTAMQEAGFDEATPLYAASGLLTYGATQGECLHACL